MNKALGIQLEEDEMVGFCYELELSKVRRTANISAVIFFMIGCFPPLMFFLWPLAAYTIYKSRNPNDNLIAGLLLTNKRFIQIHFNEVTCRSITIPVQNISKVDCTRDDIRIRSRRGWAGMIVSLVGSWLLTKTRDHFQNRREKTTEGYWESAKSVVLTYNAAQTHQIPFFRNKISNRTMKTLGVLLATGIEQGWASIGQTAEHVPEDRGASLL